MEDKVSVVSPLTILDPGVWQPLAESGLLDTRSLGRLLLLTSKGFVSESSNDNDQETMVYNMLCCNHWGAKTVQSLLSITQIPPKEYFRTMAVPLLLPPAAINSEETTLPPLKYSPKDYILIVDIWSVENNKMLPSVAIPGEEVPEFFKNECKASYSLKDPPKITLTEPKPTISIRYSVKIMRKPDRKMITLVDSTVSMMSLAEERTNKGVFYFACIEWTKIEAAQYAKPPFLVVEDEDRKLDPWLHMKFKADEATNLILAAFDEDVYMPSKLDSHFKADDASALTFYLTNFVVGFGWTTDLDPELQRQVEFAHILEALSWDAALLQPIQQPK
ncbi:MAG: hypothetical protein SGARI_000042 [Bacillariaceae sp.]